MTNPSRRHPLLRALTAVLAGAAVGLAAAGPQTIVLVRGGTAADGAQYEVYSVKCTNGREYLLTGWGDGREWCLGEESREACTNDRIRAARQACDLD